MGRLTRDPDIRYSQGQESFAIASFTLAVDRRTKDKGADFISCKAFGKTAEFCEKYARKGVKFAVSGSIQTGSYENKEGKKVYTTDVVVNTMEFAESKRKEDAQEEQQRGADRPPENAPENGFVSVGDGINEELPFV